MPKMTSAQRCLAQFKPWQIERAKAEIAEIRTRPAYHLCCLWLERLDLREAPVDYPHWRWIPVSWIENVMSHTFGGFVQTETMAIALHDRGVQIRTNRQRRYEACLDERVLLEQLSDARESDHSPRPWPRPWPQFSDRLPDMHDWPNKPNQVKRP